MNLLDLNFYREYNDDLVFMTNDELQNHFDTYGKHENRVYNSKTFSIKYFNNNQDHNDHNIKIFYESKILSNLVKSMNSDRVNKKINIFLFTNCQGHHICLLHKINIFEKYFNFYCIRNYCERLDYEEEAFNNINKLCDIFVYQPITSAHFNNTETILANIDPRIFKVSMPYTYCNWLWLFGKDINGSMDFLTKYISNNSIESNNLNNDIINDILYNNKIDFGIFDRMEKSLNILKEKELITDIKTHDFIIENYKRKRLFFTSNHLAPVMIIHIFKQLLNILNINIEINENLQLGIYNSITFYPISSYIKNILGLEYQPDSMGDTFYTNFFYDYCNNVCDEEINKKYVSYENQDMYFKDVL
jgi:hypothetical protein